MVIDMTRNDTAVNSLKAPWGGRMQGRKEKRTFEVSPSHETTDRGVRFNVETVEPATPEDQHMEPISREQVLSALSSTKSEGGGGRSRTPKLTPRRLEAVSKTPSDLVFVDEAGHGFLAACMTAFALHFPLSLGAEDIWTVISHGFAKHVENNAEALRDKFVAHEGKKKLLVVVDDFRMSSPKGGPDSGTPASEWEARVFPDFSKQIETNLKDPKVHSILTQDFSGSTPISRAVSEICLMSSMKHYFEYTMLMSRCGIPNIELRGSREDWASLRQRAEELGTFMKEDFSKQWLGVLLPILDEFVKSYDGDVSHKFWQTMVKFRKTPPGSGAHEFLSGWIQNFFPYLSNDRGSSRYLKPWEETGFSGPMPSKIPPIQCSAPCEWDYLGTKYKLDFHAGFQGFCQDSVTGALSPALGWCVSHDDG